MCKCEGMCIWSDCGGWGWGVEVCEREREREVCVCECECVCVCVCSLYRFRMYVYINVPLAQGIWQADKYARSRPNVISRLSLASTLVLVVTARCAVAGTV